MNSFVSGFFHSAWCSQVVGLLLEILLVTLIEGLLHAWYYAKYNAYLICNSYNRPTRALRAYVTHLSFYGWSSIYLFIVAPVPSPGLKTQINVIC